MPSRRLASGLQFSLAMAYIRISHPDWARPVLESLSAHDTKNALYPYWLGRLDYDAQHYPEAIHRFQQAITLDPTMARAYDNLGLCYFYQNQTDSRSRISTAPSNWIGMHLHPSPWPYLNLAVSTAVSGPRTGGGNQPAGSSPARSSACGGTLPPGQRASATGSARRCGAGTVGGDTPG